MHTDCRLTVSRGGSLAPHEAPPPPEVAPSEGRPSSEGPGHVTNDACLEEADSSPPVKRMTHACENITFPALLRYAVSNNKVNTLF